jgi:hypothetical protein
LRAPDIRKLAEKDLIQPSLFDEHDLVEICSPDFPGERLIVCRIPNLIDPAPKLLSIVSEECVRAQARYLTPNEREALRGFAMLHNDASP